MLAVEGKFAEHRWQSGDIQEVRHVCFDEELARSIEQVCGQAFKRVKTADFKVLGQRIEIHKWVADFKTEEAIKTVEFPEAAHARIPLDLSSAALHAQIRKAAFDPTECNACTVVARITDPGNPAHNSCGLFARRDIEKGTVLGVYAGEGMTYHKWKQKCTEEEKESDQVVSDMRLSYTFDCEDSAKLVAGDDAGREVQVGKFNSRGNMFPTAMSLQMAHTSEISLPL
jgi:hypothetical protein